MSRKVVLSRRGKGYSQADIGRGNAVRVPADSSIVSRRFQPRLTQKAQQSLSSNNFNGDWHANTQFITPYSLVFNTSMSSFSGYFMSPPVGDPPVSAAVGTGQTLTLKPGVLGVQLVRGYNVNLAGDGGTDPPVASESLLSKLSNTILGHLAKSTSLFRDTIANPQNLVLNLGQAILSGVGTTVSAVSQIIAAFLEALKSQPADSLTLGDWIIKQTGEVVGPDSFVENQLYTGIPEAKKEDNNALDFLRSILSDIAAIAAGATFTRLSDKWNAVVKAIKMARDIFETLCDLMGVEPDWDMPDQATIEAITDMNVLRGHLEKIMALINDLILMIPSIRNDNNRFDDPFYCIDENGELKRMACIVGGSSGGSSGWTEEMINKVFISPEVGEPFFKFSGGAIQAPWTMPE